MLPTNDQMCFNDTKVSFMTMIFTKLKYFIYLQATEFEWIRNLGEGGFATVDLVTLKKDKEASCFEENKDQSSRGPRS